MPALPPVAVKVMKARSLCFQEMARLVSIGRSTRFSPSERAVNRRQFWRWKASACSSLLRLVIQPTASAALKAPG